jgi:hypothetical protein
VGLPVVVHGRRKGEVLEQLPLATYRAADRVAVARIIPFPVRKLVYWSVAVGGLGMMAALTHAATPRSLGNAVARGAAPGPSHADLDASRPYSLRECLAYFPERIPTGPGFQRVDLSSMHLDHDRGRVLRLEWVRETLPVPAPELKLRGQPWAAGTTWPGPPRSKVRLEIGIPRYAPDADLTLDEAASGEERPIGIANATGRVGRFSLAVRLDGSTTLATTWHVVHADRALHVLVDHDEQVAYSDEDNLGCRRAEQMVRVAEVTVPANVTFEESIVSR